MDPITAIIVAAAKFGAAAVKWFAAAPFAVKAALIMGGSYLLNRALAPSIDKTDTSGVRWTPQTTQDEGIAIQQSYGINRCHANVVGSYTMVPSTDAITRGKDVTRRIKACFGEGPWAAEPDVSTVRINGRPITDFSGLTATWRLGRTNQTVLPGWSTHRQDYNIGQAVLYGSPVTWTLTRDGWDDLEVILELPNGIIHYGTDGETHSEPISIKIEVGDAVTDTWQTLVEKVIEGRVAQAAYVSFLASETYDGGTPFTLTSAMQPRVRVSSMYADSTNSRHIRDIELYAVQMTRNVGFTHPGFVVLGLSLVPDEAVSGGVTEISCISTGKVVEWFDGAFGVTRYHSEVDADILCQPVIEGDGGVTPYSATYYRGMDRDLLIGDGWSDQIDLADTIVPISDTQTDYLLRCDVIFGASTNVHSAIGQVNASGRCGLRWQGREIGMWIEEAKTPVGILCDGSWRRDSGQLSPVQADDLAASGTAHYRDATANYEDRPVRVVDSTLDTLAQVDLSLVAETRTHGAARLLRRELARNWLLDSTIRCTADLDAVIYEPGDVVYCQIDGKSLGGRITGVSADGRTVTVDRDMTEVATGADGLAVQVHDPATGVQSVEDQSATLIDARTIRVPADWTIDPVVGDVFLFGPSTITTDWYEVAEIALDQRLHATIDLAKYVTDSLDALDAIAPDVDLPLGSLDNSAYGGVRRRNLDGDILDGWIIGDTVTYEGAVVTYESEVVTYG